MLLFLLLPDDSVTVTIQLSFGICVLSVSK